MILKLPSNAEKLSNPIEDKNSKATIIPNIDTVPLIAALSLIEEHISTISTAQIDIATINSGSRNPRLSHNTVGVIESPH